MNFKPEQVQAFKGQVEAELSEKYQGFIAVFRVHKDEVTHQLEGKATIISNVWPKGLERHAGKVIQLFTNIYNDHVDKLLTQEQEETATEVFASFKAEKDKLDRDNKIHGDNPQIISDKSLEGKDG